MKLIFHGGAEEVGRSCVELNVGNDRYILDAGVKFGHDGLEYPEELFNLPEIDGMFISHGHLDHCGGLPLYHHNKLICPVFATTQTKVITKIMLKDSYKVAKIKHTHPAYDNVDIQDVINSIKVTPFEKKQKFRNLTYSFHNAGHIPGSAMVLIEAEGKKILYTGDYNLTPTNLMIPGEKNFKDIDALITESTYGYRELPPRKELEQELLEEIELTLKKGGRVLIPVFAVGRAQEILLMLAKNNWNVPIYFDGLAKKVTSKMLMNYSKYINNKQELSKMFYDKVQTISSPNRRNKIANEPGIFVTTSGMLTGGPAMAYLNHMWHDENSSIFLVGYQAKGTRGRQLLEERRISIKGEITNVKCHVRKFDFSAHSDREDLHEFIKAVNPKKLFLMHGDLDNIQELEEWAKSNTKCEVLVPKNTDEYEV